MEKFKINEAFAYAKEIGKKVMKRDLARILWPQSKEKSALANISNLCNGKTKKVDIDAVPVICGQLGVTADFLFGLSIFPTRKAEAEALQAKIEEMTLILEGMKALI